MGIHSDRGMELLDMIAAIIDKKTAYKNSLSRPESNTSDSPRGRRAANFLRPAAQLVVCRIDILVLPYRSRSDVKAVQSILVIKKVPIY